MQQKSPLQRHLWVLSTRCSPCFSCVPLVPGSKVAASILIFQVLLNCYVPKVAVMVQVRVRVSWFGLGVGGWVGLEPGCSYGSG